MTRYAVILEKGDDGYTAYVPDVPGCIGEGKSENQALRDLQREIDLWLKDLESQGEEPPPALCSVTYLVVGENAEQTEWKIDQSRLSILAGLGVSILPLDSEMVYRLRTMGVKTVSDLLEGYDHFCRSVSRPSGSRFSVRQAFDILLEAARKYSLDELRRFCAEPAFLVLLPPSSSPGTSASFYLVEESVRKSPIALLGLTPRAENALQRHGTRTIEQLLYVRHMRYVGLQGFGRKSHSVVESTLFDLFEQLAAGMRPPWESVGTGGESESVSPLLGFSPAEEEPSTGALFIDFARFLLNRPEMSDRLWNVLSASHGLEGESSTLEEIGAGYGVTRERARQIRNDAYRVIRKVLDRPQRRRESNAFPDSLRLLADAVSLFTILSPFSSESQIVDALGDPPPSERERAGLGCMLSAFGVSPMNGVDRSELGIGKERVWVFEQDFNATFFALIVRHIRKTLSGHTSGVPLDELRDSIFSLLDREWGEYEVEKASAYLSASLPLMPDVVADDDDRLFIPFEHLRSMADRTYHVLDLEGRPLHFREIARRIHEGMNAGNCEMSRSLPAVTSVLTGDDRFEPLGKTGRWKLSAWQDIRGGTIDSLIAEVLARSDTPLFQDQIFGEVRKLRQDVSVSSIRYHLRDKRDLFRQTMAGSWELSPEVRPPATLVS